MAKFYEEYYTNNRLGNGRGQVGNGRGQGSSDNAQVTTNIEVQESEKFNLMVIEFGMPMW